MPFTSENYFVAFFPTKAKSVKHKIVRVFLMQAIYLWASYCSPGTITDSNKNLSPKGPLKVTEFQPPVHSRANFEAGLYVALDLAKL